MAGLYIHIPFCAKKCIYCDFYSIGAKNAPWKSFVKSIIAELQMRCGELTENVDTIYIGGGTPSLMPYDLLIELLSSVKSILGCRYQPEEFTIEVNPDDVNDQLVDTFHQIGVNRISMGVQSFIDSELKTIGRRHSAHQVIDAYQKLSLFPNISMDLIFGLPGQTIKTWDYSLSEMLNLRPQHISAYSLMFEEGTALYLMRKQGRVDEVDDELSFRMYNLLIDRLFESGYNQYEISNFALPGFHSRHNSNYWQGVQYLGLGPSAHSFDGQNIRRANPSSINDYIRHFNSSSLGSFYEQEILSTNDIYNEYIMTRMRRMLGINVDELKVLFDDYYISHFIEQCSLHIAFGNLEEDGAHVHLSKQGVLMSDSIFIDLMM